MKKDLSNNSYYQAIKNFQQVRFSDLPVAPTVTEAALQVEQNEARMLKAFHEFNGAVFATDFFCKDYLDNCYSGIKWQVRELGMKKEFSDLVALIEAESKRELSFLYFLYCYWAVDLLNQTLEICQ